jgi:TetR/AcrR family transcriptional regulator, acrAB operon repressor
MTSMRRTKEEAARTRRDIVEAALACFDRHGIAGTTLEQIAAQAKVTKGAVYWHFTGKAEILHAIREEASIPLLDRADCTLLHCASASPLERIQRFLENMLGAIATDAHTRRALSVMQFKCEYANDLAAELTDMRRNNDRLAKSLEQAYAEARKSGELTGEFTPKVAALDTLVFLSGMIRLTLLDKTRDGIRKNTPTLIGAHIRSRRA